MENITLASFDFDDNKITERLERLAEIMNSVERQRIDESNRIKEMNGGYKRLGEAIDMLTKTGRGNSDQAKKLAEDQKNLATRMGESKGLVSEYTKNLRENAAETKKLEGIQQAQIRVQQIINGGYSAENKSIYQLREDKKALNIMRNQEVAVMGQQSEMAKTLNKALDAADQQEKNLVNERQKRFYQIGDYANQLDGHFTSLGEAFKDLFSGNIISAMNKFQSSISSINEATSQTAVNSASTTSAVVAGNQAQATSYTQLKGAVMGLVKASLAFIATPIGAAITALAGIAAVTKSLYDYNSEMANSIGMMHELFGLEGDSLTSLTLKIRTFADTVGKSEEEIAKSVRSTAQIFGITYTEALDKVSDSYYKVGSTTAGFLTMAENSGKAMEKAGFKAEEFYSIIETAGAKGLNVNAISKGFEQMSGRLTKMSENVSKDLTTLFGKTFTDNLSKSIASGELSTKEAFLSITKESEKMGINVTEQQRLIGTLFGKAGENATDLATTIEVLGEALNENLGRPLTTLEQNTKDLNDATLEYEEQLATLFNFAGGGFEGLIAKGKVFLYNVITKLIKAVISLANSFVDLYNSSSAVRASFQSIYVTFNTGLESMRLGLNIFMKSFKSVGEVIKAAFSLDGEGMLKALNNYWSDAKTSIKATGKVMGNIFADAYNETASGKLKRLEAPTMDGEGGSAKDSGGGNFRDTVTDPTAKKKDKKKNEAKEKADDALKKEIEMLNELANLTYKYAQDELANEIKNNGEKIKNAKFLTKELVDIETDRQKKMKDIRDKSASNALEEDIRKAKYDNEKRKADISALKITEYEKNTLSLKADEILKESLKIANQNFNQQRLENENEYNLKVAEITKKFADETEAWRRQNEAFELQQRIELMEIGDATEHELKLARLRQETQLENEALKEKFDNQLISREQYELAKEALVVSTNMREAEIDNELWESKMRTMGDGLSNIANLLGESTKAARIANAANALMNTYLGVTEIWASKSILPQPFGTIQKVAATAMVLKSGLDAVKKIKSATGGGGGGSSSGSMQSSAPKTQNYKADYAGGAINIPGGGAINTYNQGSITSASDQANGIADAVKAGAEAGAKAGAEAGSERGIKGMATDRQIQSNAQY